ncbi:MAG: hypothetical protein M1162_00320 [Candidatus Thermoplasmatota archaeon]|nr:hypothetical protein [Candidatus Thermoplasmatota archaeon]
MPGRGERVRQKLDRYREVNMHFPIIVEGINDVKSLRKLGFAGKILPLNNGRSLLSFAEEYSREYREAIILTDFDRKGLALKSGISSYLASLGVRPDTELWSFLRSYLPVRTIEELPRAVAKVLEENRKEVTLLAIDRRIRSLGKSGNNRRD